MILDSANEILLKTRENKLNLLNNLQKQKYISKYENNILDGLQIEDLLSQAKSNVYLSNATYAHCRRTIVLDRIDTSQKAKRVQISNKFLVFIYPIFKTDGPIVCAHYLYSEYNAKLILENKDLEKRLHNSTISRRRQ